MIAKRLEKILDRIVGRIEPEELVTCPNLTCKERGNYIMCIYDKIPDCEEYRKYMEER